MKATELQENREYKRDKNRKLKASSTKICSAIGLFHMDITTYNRTSQIATHTNLAVYQPWLLTTNLLQTLT